MRKEYNLFISHCWSYDEDYVRLCKLLDKAEGFQWKNYSVSADDPLAGGSRKKLAEEIDRQIRLASAVLVISGIYVSYREWIQFEIDLADRYNKPLVGIVPWGNTNIPDGVRNSAWEIVNWSTSSIIDAIVRNVGE
jgi:hypothetical protein